MTLKDVGAGLKPAPTREGFVNRVHVDDAVSGIKLLLEKGRPGEIYLGVDNEPATEEEFYSWMCENFSIKRPADPERTGKNDRGSGKRCSNKKMKALGWALKYPTFKEGYQALMKEI